ncbi:MAG: glycosyl hydrolase family 28 protein [Opitutaceae bacterium]
MFFPSPGTPLRLVVRLAFAILLGARVLAADFEVRSFGASGDGKALDTDAINKAIDAAAASGGGTVRFSAGSYLSFSIRLKSNITLHLDPGATLVAATPAAGFGGYDAPEPNEWGDRPLPYQDFGHSHWHNSLIWGENLVNVSITGSGLIDGTKGLARNAGGGGGGRGRGGQGQGANAGATTSAAPATAPAPASPGPAGGGDGNKAIALKNCRNVIIRDISILMGGHFALLATGVDNLTLDNIKVDTNRDGFDIDACRHVRVSNCSVNAPHDDAIVLKSSYALGEARPCENITITNCQVTGFDPGTFLDGTYKRTMERAPDRDGPTGRIKFGTESNGGFKNITISNCVFDRSRGIALETVDGGPIEDITITNITMRDVSNAPIFLRLGARQRGPDGMPISTMRRINISNIVVSDADPRYPSIIAGLPGHPIEDVRLSNIRIVSKGGLTMDQISKQPPELANNFFQRAGGRGGPNGTGGGANAGGAPATPAAPVAGAPGTPRDPYDVPEREDYYPEPSMFGLLPAYGLFVRHATNVVVERFEVSFAKADERPAIVLMDVAGIEFDRIKAQRAPAVPLFVLRDVKIFSARSVTGLPDTVRAVAGNETL